MAALRDRPVLLFGVIVLVLVGAVAAWWLAAPLFLDRTVDEPFPFDLPTEQELAAMPAETLEAEVATAVEAVEEGALDEMPEAEREEIADTVMSMAAEMPAHEMDEPMPEAAPEWVTVASGTFRDADSFHRGSGSATIFERGGERVLRFEEFEVTNGPDLHVLLVENPDATDHDTIGEYVDLGALKGNVGAQNYEIPTDVDLSQYGGVMIYCMPFHVVFSTAPLTP